MSNNFLHCCFEKFLNRNHCSFHHQKGNLHKYNYYTTTSLINHPSDILLQVINKWMEKAAEKFLADEQTGFRPGRDTVVQIGNVRILGEKLRDHQLEV